jgi:uncharacterized caspase-like protein
MILRIFLACLLGMAASTASAQQVPRKIALIIANGNYVSSGQLANPVNDGTLVAAAARRAGFETVTLARNLNLADFQARLREFREQAAGAQVAMIYYAGHGIERAGRNWLLPTDARLSSPLDLPYEAIDLERVLEAVSGARIRIVVLDACRNNPFGRSWQGETRSLSRGLAGVDVDDVLVIYAAAPGQTANDGAGPNSPFATSFALRIVQPGLPVQLLGGVVRDDVLASTGGAQRPYVSASITGTPVYLVAPNGASTQPSSAAAASAPAPVDMSTLDALAWQGAVRANTPEAYQEYIHQFPQGRFAALARQNIAAAQRPKESAAAASPPQEQNGAAEETYCRQRFGSTAQTYQSCLQRVRPESPAVAAVRARDDAEFYCRQLYHTGPADFEACVQRQMRQ